ncbi:MULTISPECIES: hypothetical protein [Moorena]|nr:MULTISPECIES: hypothetical protein [Moorena]
MSWWCVTGRAVLTSEETENNGEPVPEAPLATPYSLLPTPYSLLH